MFAKKALAATVGGAIGMAFSAQSAQALPDPVPVKQFGDTSCIGKVRLFRTGSTTVGGNLVGICPGRSSWSMRLTVTKNGVGVAAGNLGGGIPDGYLTMSSTSFPIGPKGTKWQACGIVYGPTPTGDCTSEWKV